MALRISKDVMPISYAKKACDTLMRKFRATELPPYGRFHYHQGVFLSGMQHCFFYTQEERYFHYIKEWVDSIIDQEGIITCYDQTELDDLQAGILLFDLYEKTKETRYTKALSTLLSHLTNWKVNEEGGFWHKDRYPNQMWLDGLYMAGPLAVRYGINFNAPEYLDRLAYQALLMADKTWDEATGLLVHGWDASKKAEWADAATGKAPECWGRAIGWYVVAVLDMLEILPKEHKDCSKLIHIVTLLLTNLIKYQNKKSGRWYQVVDKGEESQNWQENSCTALFAYAIAKAVRLGLMEKEFLYYALKGYKGVVNTLLNDEEGGIILKDICIGTGIGDYEHYIHRPTSENDLHGMGAFILMCVEMQLANIGEME